MKATFIRKIKPSAYVIPSVRKTKFRSNMQEEEKKYNNGIWFM
jgi:hypothetical protein